MNYKIPSKWTKDDFCSIAFDALLEFDSNASDIALDLHDCLRFGFSNARSYGFRFDYSSFANEGAKWKKRYH